MAFWGLELKPGISTRLSFDGQPKKILRITQATLGVGSGAGRERVGVECQVSGKDRIRICSMVPELNESCQIDLSFRDSDQAVLSVVGPSTVYLFGYYTANLRRPTRQPFGEDLGECDTEEEDEEGEENEASDDSMEDFIVSDDISSPNSSHPYTRKIVDKKEGGIKRRGRLIVSSDSD